jgi:hypothetical protein
MVERAVTGKGYCAWCDTLIAKGEARVARALYHAPGQYIRDSQVSGYNPGGRMHLYLHPQCAWHLADTRRRRTAARCNHCKADIQAGFCIKTLLSSAAKRCSQSSTAALFSHFKCTHQFIQKHRTLLDGYVGAKQREETIAWGEKPGALHQYFGQVGATGGAKGGVQAVPSDKTAKKDYLNVFKTTAAAEEEAVERHISLQRQIHTRLADDEARGGKLQPG